jgi:hypothetical protein
MASVSPASQKARESTGIKPAQKLANEQNNAFPDYALPSIALLTAEDSLPGSGVLRQQNMLALQSKVGNAAIQRMLVQREDNDTPPAEGESESEAGSEEEEIDAERVAFQEGVSTPIPEDAEIGEGQATVGVGGAAVTIRPDATTDDESLRDQAVTTGGITSWGTPSAATEGGVVTSIEEMPQPTVEIQTTYGPGASASSESGYGRGTTEEDEAAGQTTLGHHEGSHGQTTLDYLSENPLPEFTGEVGMTAEEYQAACDAYDTAMEEYAEAMQAHQVETVDCVGDEASFCEAEEESAEGEEGHEH